MILGTFDKQPAETLDFDIDFSQILDDGDTLVTTGSPPVPSPLNVNVSPTGLTVLSTFVTENGKTVKQWLSGGSNRVKYKITITVTSNAGRVKQAEYVVNVRDV